LRSRKKSAKTRLTKARNQLADLVDKKDIGLGNLPTKTEIRKAVFKVESEFNIIIKLIYSIKEIIALEHGEEHTAIDEILEALDNEVEELTVIVDTAVKRAKEHIQQRRGSSWGKKNLIQPHLYLRTILMMIKVQYYLFNPHWHRRDVKKLKSRRRDVLL
jgi:hypothetical protein